MLKTIEWDNPNKMHMDSGFKLFDKQTNLITTGNVYANTQYSSYIRPYKEIKNYGYTGNPGDFLKLDMESFRGVPEIMKEVIYDRNREKSVILYQFKVFHGKKKEIIGYVLTTYDYKYISHVTFNPYRCNYIKRENAIYEAMKYICDKESLI